MRLRARAAWTIAALALTLGVAAGTWWLLGKDSHTKGADIAGVLGLGVTVVSLVVAVLFGVVALQQAARERQARRAALVSARQAVLQAWDRPVLKPPEQTISTLLAPEQAVMPIQGREQERQQLLRWCADPDASTVRVMSGPAGVGKTRLAVEVSRSLPAGWVAGRCLSGRVGEVFAPVAECGDPTLIVIDDADTEPGIAQLVQQVTRHDEKRAVKVLLLVRAGAAFERWLHPQLPAGQAARWPRTDLSVIGGIGDRSRWYAQAVRAYAAVLNLEPPPVSDSDHRPVGSDGEPMVLTQARAVLASRIGTRYGVETLRNMGLDQVATELVTHEQRRWNQAAEDARWALPVELTSDVRDEALLALVLLAPTSVIEAVAVLRRLPTFREGEAAETMVRNVVEWAHHLYPGPQKGRVEPTPDFVAAALVAQLAGPDRAALLDALDLGAAAERDQGLPKRLVRAVALFSSAGVVLRACLVARPTSLAAVIEAGILLGPTVSALQQIMVEALTSDPLPDDDVDRLLELIGDAGWTHLRLRLWESAVQRYRTLVPTDPARYTPELALSVSNLARSLREVGEPRQALDNDQEAVRLYGELAQAQPDRYARNLAASLGNLAVSLREVGETRQALDIDQEVMRLYQELAQVDPAHTADLVTALGNLAQGLRDVGEPHQAVDIDQQAARLYRELAQAESARSTSDLARSLSNLALSLDAVADHDQAVRVRAEVVAWWRRLAQRRPEEFDESYQRARAELSRSLFEQGNPDPAAAIRAEREAVEQLSQDFPDTEPDG
jgi:tetratricopeptide (TPR) repeat protein